jgi:hypothetical protein
MIIRRWTLLALLALFAATVPLPAAPAVDVFAADRDGMHHRLCERLFKSLQTALEKLTARLTQAESVDLSVTSLTMDERHRVYLDLEGMIEFKFSRMNDKIEKKMNELLGNTLHTNGPIACDFLINVVDRTTPEQFHVEFQMSAIFILDELLSKLVRAGANIVGTLTLMGVGNDLASFLDSIDSEVVAVSLDAGFRDMTKVVMSLAGVEAYDAYRELRPNRAGDGSGGSVTGAVLAHLALALVKGATGVATNLAGMSLGAMVGTAIAPGVGTTIGGILGAAGMQALGNVSYRKLAVDMPMAYRLVRIKRLHFKRVDATDQDRIEYLTRKLEKYEIKILKRVSLELRTDRFQFLSEFMQQIRKYSPQEREAFRPLYKQLKEKLRFEVVERNDRLAQRMMAQLDESFVAPEK